MTSSKDIDALLEQLHTAASQSDETRSQVLDGLQALQYKLEASQDTTLRFTNLQLQTAAAQIGEDIKIFKILSESPQPVNVTDLAVQTGAAPLLLSRILRYLASVGQIKETERDVFTANNITKTLAQPGFRGHIYHTFHTVGTILQAFPDFLAETKYHDVDNVAKTAAQKAFGIDMPGFVWLPTQPERFEAFQQAMTVQPQNRIPWFSVFPLETELKLDTYSGTHALVDVGGGFGHQCMSLAAAFPALRGKLVLQELPQTVAMLPPLEGVEVMAYDFFTPQPIKDAKFYYLRNVIHDWQDEQAVAILSQVRAALGPESQVLIDDIVLPTSGVHWHAAAYDLIMMSSFSSRERTIDEWHALLDKAGLRILKVHTYLPRRQDSIIQAVAK